MAEDEKLGDAAMLSGVAKFPARIKCATLAWKALEQLLLITAKAKPVIYIVKNKERVTTN